MILKHKLIPLFRSPLKTALRGFYGDARIIVSPIPLSFGSECPLWALTAFKHKLIPFCSPPLKTALKGFYDDAENYHQLDTPLIWEP